MKKIIKFVKNINKQIVFNVFVVIAIATQFNYKIFSTKNTDILGFNTFSNDISSADQEKINQLRIKFIEDINAYQETTRHLVEWSEVAKKVVLHNEKNIEALFKSRDIIVDHIDARN